MWLLECGILDPLHDLRGETVNSRQRRKAYRKSPKPGSDYYWNPWGSFSTPVRVSMQTAISRKTRSVHAVKVVDLGNGKAHYALIKDLEPLA